MTSFARLEDHCQIRVRDLGAIQYIYRATDLANADPFDFLEISNNPIIPGLGNVRTRT